MAKSAEEAVRKSAKSSLLPTVAVKAGHGYADPDGYWNKIQNLGLAVLLRPGVYGTAVLHKCY